MPIKLLFLCTHNACRSVLCEVIVRQLADGIHTASAGSEPRGSIHPDTLAELSQRGYSTEGLQSQGIDELQGFQPDVVVTVCDSAAKEACPVWLDPAIKIHWGLPDPSAAPPETRREAFAEVIGLIEDRARALASANLAGREKSDWPDIFNDIAFNNIARQQIGEH